LKKRKDTIPRCHYTRSLLSTIFTLFNWPDLPVLHSLLWSSVERSMTARKDPTAVLNDDRCNKFIAWLTISVMLKKKHFFQSHWLSHSTWNFRLGLDSITNFIFWKVWHNQWLWKKCFFFRVTDIVSRAMKVSQQRHQGKTTIVAIAAEAVWGWKQQKDRPWLTYPNIYLHQSTNHHQSRIV